MKHTGNCCSKTFKLNMPFIFRSNFLKLLVYFEDLNHEVIEEVPVYDVGIVFVLWQNYAIY
jgi:hypothetical protein